MTGWKNGWRRWLTVMFVAMLGRSAGAQTLVLSPGVVTTVAGNGSSSYSGASYSGPALGAGLNFPRRVAEDSNGNLYWMEKGGLLVRVLASGKGAIPSLPGVAAPVAGSVYTVAGGGTPCAAATDKFGDGCPATQSTLNAPYGIAVDANANVYLGDTGNNLIHVVYAAGGVPGLTNPVRGNVYVVAGTGTAGAQGDGGPATSAQISTSHGLTVDGKGNIFFADSGNNSVRAVYSAGTLPGIANPVVGNLYTLAGGATPGACAKPTSACGDGGPARSAQINGPDSVAVDASGNIYIGDTSDYRLRAIYVSGALPGISQPTAGDMYTVAGNGASGSGPDGVAATASSLTNGMGQPAANAVGILYIPDATSNVVRRIDVNGVITTAINGAGPACAAATDAFGDGCPANATLLSSDTGVVVDPSGDVYVADYKNNLIRRLQVGTSVLNMTGTVGAAVTATATVTNGGTQPLKLSGVMFSGPFTQTLTGTADCASGVELAAGASCQIVVSASSNAAGNQTGTVIVQSNALNAVSEENMVQLASVITLGQTTTSASASALLANIGQPVTLTATVQGPATVQMSPTGSVTFMSGATPVGSASLAGGVASFAIAEPAAGSYSFTAVYGGDANFKASTSSAVSFAVSAKPVPIVTLTPPSSGVTAGQPVSFTANVQPYAGAQIPTGMVTLQQGAITLAQASLGANGMATLPVASLPVGVNVLTLNYGGDSTFIAISAPPLKMTVTSRALLSVFPGRIVTAAGSYTLGAGYGGDNGTATAAQVKTPLGMDMDASGNLFFADSGNNRIRRVDAANGTITTVAGTGTACAAAPCGDNGLATAAQLNGPQGVRVDAAGNLYILDKGEHAVRKVNAVSRIISTVAGTLGSAGYSGDGAAATAAKLNGPRGLYLDNQGDLYIGDSSNAAVRRVDAVTGIITTVAGTGTACSTAAAVCGDGGAATAAQLINPRGLTMDEAGNLYIADASAFRVRRVDAATHIMSTVAGTGTACTAAPCGDGGMATAAQFAGPQDILAMPAGDLVVSDPGMNAVRRISPGGAISTIAGEPSTKAGYLADNSAATAGLLSYPNSLLLDGQGNLYLSEANNSLIREVLSGNTSLNFGSASLGTDTLQAITLASTGNQQVSISDIATLPDFAQAASGGVDCVSTLALSPGSSCALVIDFSPLVSGSSTGNVAVSDTAANTSAGQTLIAVAGKGVASSGTTAQSITFSALPNVVYSASPIALQATASSGLGVTFHSVTGPAMLSGSTLTLLGAGTVSVTAYQFGDNTYAEATPVTQTFTVSPAQLLVTANNATRAIGAVNPAFTYTVTGFVNHDTAAVVTGTPVLATTATAASPAGTYPITVTAGTLSAANYGFTYVNGTLTIAGQIQTITFPAPANTTYGGSPVMLGAVSSSGLPVSYVVQGPATVHGATLSVTGAGTVTVTATQAGNTDYAAATPVPTSFQVLPATLTVTANNASRIVNTANPVFTDTFTGFVGNDSASAISGVPSFSSTATMASPAGTYPIVIGAGTLNAANYRFAFVNGLLTVTPPAPDFTLSSNPSSLTLEHGSTGIVQVTLTPISNYAGSVTITCGSLPPGVSCNFTPAALVADGSGQAVSGTLNIVTTDTAMLHLPGERRSKVSFAGLFLLPGLLLLAPARRRWRRSAIVCVAGLAAMFTVSGCGSAQRQPVPVVTTIAVTATASGAAATSHALILNITVI